MMGSWVYHQHHGQCQEQRSGCNPAALSAPVQVISSDVTPPHAVRSRGQLTMWSDDGYNWLRYAQTDVKGSEIVLRSYYRCSFPGCSTKRQVGRSKDGQIIEVKYTGTHNHAKPRDMPSAKAHPLHGGGDASEHSIGGTSEKSSECAVDDDEDAGVGLLQAWNTGGEGLDKDEPDYKRQRKDGESEGISTTAGSRKMVRESRIVIQTVSEMDILDDGYRWRKYGQKVVKGSRIPRSYYKCTTRGCPVRKHVERASHDPRVLVTTYKGTHNHYGPAACGAVDLSGPSALCAAGGSILVPTPDGLLHEPQVPKAEEGHRASVKANDTETENSSVSLESVQPWWPRDSRGDKVDEHKLGSAL